MLGVVTLVNKHEPLYCWSSVYDAVPTLKHHWISGTLPLKIIFSKINIVGALCNDTHAQHGLPQCKCYGSAMHSDAAALAQYVGLMFDRRRRQ